MSGRNSPAMAAVLVAAMGLYFVGAPTACFIFQSWWPLAIGLGAMLGVLCLVMVVTLLRDARDEATGVPSLRESDEHADAGDLPRPHRTGKQDRKGQS